MNKKYLLNLLTMMMVALANVSFVSCGDDDDEEEVTNNDSIIEHQLIGSWELRYVEWGGERVPFSKINILRDVTYTFNADHTMTYHSVDPDYDNNGAGNTFFGTWEYKNKTITWRVISNGIDSHPVGSLPLEIKIKEIKSNEFIDEDGGVYVRIK